MKNIDKSKGIILSYPRSGLNWVRYCIEYFSGKRTPGRMKLISSGAPVIYRSHNVQKNNGPNSCTCRFYDENGDPMHENVVLILRNYRETFIRSKRNVLDNDGKAPGKLIRRINEGEVKSFKHYFENIRAYDSFQGSKLLIRYEDLVKDFSVMEEILDFLSISHNTKNFDLAEHREKSIGIYDSQHKSFTKRNVKDFKFHQKFADPGIIKALDKMVKRDHGDIFQKYLKIKK